jgi:uncharacterized Ntn-hydrolase superfamily protein
MKNIIVALILVIPFIGKSQHTFSIVAVDSITGEIGSAGATCGDSIIWPGTPGALIISDIIPGVGAIHTQSYHNLTNQSNAHNRMILGDSPQDIITWLVANDVASDPLIRQYGIVDYNGGSPRSSAYTGSNCFNYKNHILGSNYAIQGNILLGQEILDSMESRFNNTDGCLSDKLMAAMQGAKVIGADTRCTTEGTSSLSAFLRVAKPTDHPDTLSIDLNIAGTPSGVEPIDKLQTKYNNWKSNNSNNCSLVSSNMELTKDNSKVVVYPNPTNGLITIKGSLNDITKIIVTDVLGGIVMSKELILHSNEIIQITLDHLNDGTYIIVLSHDNEIVTRNKITLHNTK